MRREWEPELSVHRHPSGLLVLRFRVRPRDYLALAWMTSALATLGGALGSGLETSDEVREAAYTYHRERREWKENDENDEKGSG